MKKYKPFQSLIAIVLVVITVFSTVSVSAEPLSEAVKADQATSENIDEGNAPAEFLEEEIEKREENTKYFKMSDGTIQAAQYSVPVHFEQDGKWVDYDNTLEEVDADESELNHKIAKNKDLMNRTADYKVRLSKKTNGKKFVRLEKDGYKISWYYTNADKSTAKIIENEKDEDPTTLENLSSAVLYEEVFNKTDFEYIIGSDGLKENIILNSKKSPCAFEAVYKANGLIPVQIDNKTIELRSDDESVVYVITAPYMEDENGQASGNITLTLTDVKNNTFTVKMVLDQDWLLADDREFPVIVDPMLKTNQTPSGVQSAFVSSKYPNKCYKASTTDDMGSLYVGNIYEFGKTESYIKFTTLPKLGIADKVVDARLYIGLRQCQLGLPVNIKRLINDWNEKTVTWNNGPYGDSNISDYMMLTEDTDTTKFREVEITDMVRGWYSGEYPNYGLSLTTTKTESAKAWFYSINYTTYPQNRPILTVSYRNMSGYEDYWSYTELSGGRGGAASVNNYNGNFIFSQPVTQDAGGNLLPLNISLIYNSNKENTKFVFPGNQFQTNYNIFVRKETGELWNNGYKYYLNDSDGTKHWFYFEKSSDTKGKDEDGLGYTIEVFKIGSNTTEPKAGYIITDKDENKMYFDYYGALLRIENASKIAATLSYEPFNGSVRLKNIKDGAGRLYTFNYSSSSTNQIASITDPANRKTTFTYNNNYLTKISFADSKTVQFSYSGNLLSQIKDINGNRTKINYDSSSQRRVSSFNYGASDSDLLEKYAFTYKQNETAVTDLQNRIYTYQFNDYGQTTGTVSNTDGSAQFFELSQGNDTSGKANKLLSESRVLQSTTNYVVNPGFVRSLTNGYWVYMNDKTGASVTSDTGRGNITNSSAKVVKPASNKGRVNVVQTINDLPGGTYTLSAYIFTDGKTIPGDGVQMFAEVHKAGNTDYVYSKNIEKTAVTNGWERRSVTFDVPEGGTVRATMGFGPNASGTVWFDDVQLEKSANASTYNLVENSAFTNGTTNWTTWSTNESTVTWAGLPGFANCGKLTGTVKNQYKRQRQYLNVSGKKGDVFAFGAWAYAFSAPLNNTKASDAYKPRYELAIDYYDKNGSWKGCMNKYFNADIKNAWQFLADELIMPSNYGNIAITFTYDHNVNNAYQTGAFCYKEQYGQTYDYDKNGNVVSAVDLAKTNSTFSYYGNQMAKMLNPSGSKYLYSYNDQKQLTASLSSDGVEYGFTYDAKGNVTKAEIIARNPATSLEPGKEYIIVNAYSGNAINAGITGTESETLNTTPYERNANKQQWRAEAVSGKTDVFYLKAVKHGNRYLDVHGASGSSGANIQIYRGNSTDAQKFKFVKQADGSFGIFTASSNYNLCLDAQFDSSEIIKQRALKQSTCDKNNLKESQKWYVYPVAESFDRSIVTQSSYTESKNFVSSSTDERGNVTEYSYDETKGLLNSTSNANGVETQYTYDGNNDALLSVSSGGVTNHYSYSNDLLQNINVNDHLQYKFAYDQFGRTTGNYVGNGTNWRTLSTIQYNSSGLMSKQTYGNGDYVEFSYDNLDRQTQKRYNGNNSQRVTYSYGNNGSVAQITDYYTNTNTRFVYDLADRVVSQREFTGTDKSGGTLRSYTDFTYADKTNYLTGVKHYSPLGTQNIGYRYGDLSKGEMPDQIYSVTWNGKEKVSYVYDGLGRLTTKNIGSFDTGYSYENVGEDKTTTLVKSVATPAGTYTYTYDNIGNILSVSDGSKTTSYEYDSLNQLVRVNDERAGKTYTYSYSNGNITEKKEYAFTTGELGEAVKTLSWRYENDTWRDLLTNYKGNDITYDEIGNPVTIGSTDLTWVGRQLMQVADENNTVSYAYNGDGQRVSKTVNGTTTEYFYNGEILAGQKTGDDVIVFMYDNNGDTFGFIYNGTEYYYIKNAQNDIVAIADADGSVIANYYYDAWGYPEDITGNTEIANLNPLRYRSYYYDTESELYYLNTRYYCAEIGRFLSSDGYIQTGQGILDKNMFAYCLNNPVNLLDQTGEIAGWAIALIVIATCTIIGGVAGGVIGCLNKNNAYTNAYTNSQNNNSNSQNNRSTNSNKGNSNNSNSNSKSSSKKTKSYSNTQSSSKDTYQYEEKLKPQEIAMNVFIGATVGLAVGGALVMSGGALAAVIGNIAACSGATTVCGVSTLAVIQGGQQAVAIGMLAYNLEAMVFGPFYFAELEPIEWKAE